MYHPRIFLAVISCLISTGGACCSPVAGFLRHNAPGRLMLADPILFIQSYSTHIISSLIIIAILLSIIIALWINIMGRHRAQSELRRSENTYRAFFTHAPIPYQSLDEEGRIIEVNPAWLEVLGYDRDEVIGKSFAEFLPPETTVLFAERFASFRNEGVVCDIAFKLRHKDGHYIDTLFDGVVRYEDDGAFRQTYCAFKDISASKRAESMQAMQLRLIEYAADHSIEELLRKCLDEVEDITDSTVSFFHLVDEAEENLALKVWSARTLEHLHATETLPNHFSIAQEGTLIDCFHQRRPIIHNDHISPEHTHTSPRGQAPIAREIIVPVVRKNKIVAVLGIGNKPTIYDKADIETIQHIAEIVWENVVRKRAENALKQSEERFRLIANSSIEDIWQLDLEGRVTYTSPAVNRVFGYTSDEVKGTQFSTFFPEHEMERAVQAFVRAVAGEEYQVLEFDGVRKDGSDIPIEVSVTPIVQDDTIIGVQGIARDITERRQAETALRASEQFNRAIIENSPLGISVRNRNGCLLAVNRAWREIWSVPEEAVAEFMVSNPDELTFDPQDTYLNHYREEVERVYREGGLLTIPECRCDNHRSGETRWVSQIFYGLHNDNCDVDKIVVITTDITERKRSEQALRDQQNHLQSIFRVAPTGIGVVRNRVIMDVNQQVCEMTGYTAEELIGKSARMLYPTDEEYDYVGREKYRQIENYGTGAVETRWRRKDNTIIDIFVTSTPIDNTDPAKGLTFTALDITERKKAEQSLRESEFRYRTIADYTYDWETWVSPSGTLLYCSPSIERVTGYSADDIQRDPDLFAEMIYPGDRDMIMRHFHEELNPNTAVEQMDFRIITRDGRTRWVTHSCVPVFSDDGEFMGRRGSTRDITDRLERETKYSSVLNTAIDGFWMVNADGRIAEANQSAADMLGYTIEELCSLHVHEIDAGEDSEEIRIYIERIKTHGSDLFETRHYRKDGSLIDVEVNVSYLPFNQGFLVAFTRDITERKRSESEREITIRFFQELSNTRESHELMAEVTRLLQEWSGCEAVGIRLKEGDDYPYYETRGFSDDFVKAETSLCQIMDDGDIRRDCAGNSVLECMCGNVICGRTNPDLPFFTGFGSFWTNSTTDLLAATSEEDRQTRTRNRNRCHAEGYESVALIPLRHGDRTLGLLQFNDSQRDRFNPALITLFEHLAANLALGLVHRWAAEELREREADLKRAQAIAKIGNYTWDISSGRLYWSDELKKIRGCAHAEPSFDKILTQIHPEDYDRVIEMGRLAREEFHPYDIEYRIILDDGTIRYLHDSAEMIRDDSGNTIAMFGTAQDITDRKLVEEALVESEARYQELFNSVMEGIGIVDENEIIQYANPAFVQILGENNVDDIIGKSVLDYFGPAEQQKILAETEQRKTGECSQYELAINRSDGKIRYAHFYVTPRFDRNGQYAGAFGTILDITETRRLKELESRAERLEMAGTIAGQVAHDFNNIMAPIIAYPEFIRDELSVDHQVLPYIDAIEDAAKKMVEINQDLLTMGRRGHYNQRVFNLNTIVSQAVKELKDHARHITFDLKLCDDLMPIKGGPAQIHRTIVNLLVNARDAVHGSGRILLKTENFYADDTSIAFGRVPKGEYIKLTISDTGCGIPEEIIQRIFDPFFSTKTADRKRGSGLGLSVVDAVVKDHRGYLDLRSTVGRGTSFYIYFPIAREETDDTDEDVVIGGDEKVLIVDDDDIQRKVTSKLLTRLGYTVSFVESGERAVELLRHEPHDLVVLDMVMPGGIDGADTYRRILEYNPEQKAIILSGFSESDRVLEAQKLGAGGFVLKPVTSATIASAVRKELDREGKPVA